MNSWPLVLAAAGTGLAGSLHCVAMCGALQRMAIRGIPIRTVGAANATVGLDAADATVGAIGMPGPPPGPVPGAGRWLRFQLGRLLGYGTLGRSPACSARGCWRPRAGSRSSNRCGRRSTRWCSRSG